MSDQKKLFLLDAYALIYRAHFAFTKNPRINSKGHNTSVPFGFTNTLLEVLTKQKPTHIAIAFDTAKPTFRDEIYKEYKANRQETPEDIRYGIPKVWHSSGCSEIRLTNDLRRIYTKAFRQPMRLYPIYVTRVRPDTGCWLSDEPSMESAWVYIGSRDGA